MSLVIAAESYRFRVLGDRGTFVKRGVDPQEAALREGEMPTREGWGEEPESEWGTLYDGERATRVRTEPGSYLGFYAGVAAALLDGAPPPVDPADAVRTLQVLEEAKRLAAATDRRTGSR